MLRIHPKTRFALSTALLLSLAACGGGGSGGFLPTGGTNTGGSSSGAGGDTATPAAAKLSGIAATGAAFAGAKVTVIDQRGITVCSTETDAKGAYECPLPAGTKAPLVITAARDDLTLYSTTASAAGGNVNVTPLTTIIVSRLAPNGDPANLAGAIATQPDVVTDATVKQQVAELIAALQPLMTLIGDAVDPISGSFTADGSGHDRLLDSIAVSVRPDGTAANIEITVKSVPATEGAAPVSIVFRSSDATPPALPQSVATATLAPAGASLAVAALFERLTQCYALPLSKRVNAPNDTAPVSGGAADVIAPECKTLFANDDPASFLNNGNKVGSTGAFSSLFRPGATGLKFDRGVQQFFRPNGDMVLSYRSVDSTGAEQNQTLVAKSVDGVLKLIGNQYSYNVNVLPTVQDREFLHAPASSYLNVAYNVTIPKGQTKGLGNPLVQAVVTAPNGAAFTYRPGAGNANLVVDKPNGLTGNTSLLRIAAGYRDPARSGHPSASEPNAFFLPQLSDEELRQLPEQGVFTVVLTFQDSSTVTQTHRLITRVPTIAEARQRKFADMTPALRAEVISGSVSSGAIVFDAPSAEEPSLIDFSAEGDVDGWTVPAGAVAPTALTAYGKSSGGVDFEDRVDVPASARKAKIFCSAEPGGDDHCGTFNGNPVYAANTRVTLFQLSATDAQQVLFLKGFATYMPAN